MKIAVCDSSCCFREAFRKEIFDYDPEIEVRSFANYEELLSCSELARLDCVFLATELNAVSGMETAVSLKQANMNAEVFFVTENCEKYAQQIFYNADIVRPFALLVKPVSRSLMRHMLDIYKRDVRERNSVRLSFRLTDGSHAVLPVNSILYIEHCNRISYIHTSDKCLESRVTISFFDERLPSEQFIHSAKSVIVNANTVKAIEQNRIILSDETELFPSRNYKKQFLSSFIEYTDKHPSQRREHATI